MNDYMHRERNLIERFPEVDWTEPQPVTVGELTLLTCRFCTALDGLPAADLTRRGFKTREQHEAHLHTIHALRKRGIT